MHWTEKNALKQYWRQIVVDATRDMRVSFDPPYTIEVQTHCTRKLSTFDIDNRSVKPLLDGIIDQYEVIFKKRTLIDKGILRDDNAEIIRQVVVTAFHSDRDFTKVLIREYKE